jgi:hypothetical protein
MRLTALLATLWLAIGAARADPELRMPPGTRTTPTGEQVSGRGLRESTDFLAKQLDKAGIVVKKIGPYRVRGVELTRFVSQTPSTSWLALHVVRAAGKTVISFVPRPPS